MDHIHRERRPSLRRPRALLAWEGWNDACDVASNAITYLLGQHDDPDPFAWVEPEEFYDFQARRPTVTIDTRGTRSLSWPLTRTYAVETDSAHDLVIGVGDEPNLRWKTYTRSVARLLADADVELVVMLGAFIGPLAHTIPVPIVGVATDPEMIERHQLIMSEYEGPTGILGVMLEACREIGIPAVGLWAATPHYLSASPNPKATLALLEKASKMLDVEIDTTELAIANEEFQTRLAQALVDNEELGALVSRLERDAAAIKQSVADEAAKLDPSNGTELISEIEDFLKEK